MTGADRREGLGGASVTMRENLRIGLDGLLSHKLRSLLTTLGIIFGVAAVIAMISISAGAQHEILNAIQSLGVNNVLVNVRIPDDQDELLNNKRTNPDWLTEADADALRALLADASHVIPVRREDVNAVLPERRTTGIVGTIPEFADVFNVRLTAGRFFSADDDRRQMPVAVITEPLRRELFPLTNPLGKRMKVEDAWFTVVGVIQPVLGGLSAAGLDMPDMSRDIYAPLNTVNSRFAVGRGSSPLGSVVVRVPDENKVRTVAQAAERIISRRHHGVTDFEIIVPVELLAQSRETQRIFNIVMGAIASISLLVGGIGIMNIMLSNVVERTREIGVRRAMGARRSDVISQFLLEAVLLSLIGGVAGIAVGVLMAWGITQFAGWRTTIGPVAVLLAFGVSATVGVVFGWWPAKKAAEMDVINALRHE
ncbi:MAG: Macrolide export ATP-binding/permease protein MacB [Calditrichaeota bacterium]|nr:Macrolide export ATP-binding/permease protein MacB [Calditrichota bacterium]